MGGNATFWYDGLQGSLRLLDEVLVDGHPERRLTGAVTGDVAARLRAVRAAAVEVADTLQAANEAAGRGDPTPPASRLHGATERLTQAYCAAAQAAAADAHPLDRRLLQSARDTLVGVAGAMTQAILASRRSGRHELAFSLHAPDAVEELRTGVLPHLDYARDAALAALRRVDPDAARPPPASVPIAAQAAFEPPPPPRRRSGSLPWIVLGLLGAGWLLGGGFDDGDDGDDGDDCD